MKKLLILLLSAYCMVANAQLSTPNPSPEMSWTTTLGFTKISILYARPLARGREVFGKLVPYGQLWRTGASDCTQFKFNQTLEIGGTAVQAGNYSLFTIPESDQWTVVINADTTMHGTSGYDEKKDVVRFKVKPEKASHYYEMFTIEIQDEVNYAANLAISWENTTIKIPLKSNADATIMAEIDDKINKKKIEDANLFYNAAAYYNTNKRELEKALVWSQKAEAIDGNNFYYVNLSTKILENLKQYPQAIISAKRAVVLGNKNNMPLTVKNWENKIAEWEKITGVLPNSATTNQPVAETQKEATVPATGPLSSVFDGYFAVKDALVKTDAAASAIKAGDLLKALKVVKMGDLSSNAHASWMKTKTQLVNDAQFINQSKVIAQQRERFIALSKNMYDLIKASKPNEVVYYQYCPMANNGNGANWLSRESAVKNPYFGSMMLNCGKVQETIK